MAVSSTLERYLELERLMLVCDHAGDPAADVLRDAMDPIWYSLGAEERQWLDRRSTGDLAALEAIRLPIEPGLFLASVPGPVLREIPVGPITNWRMAA